MGRQKHDWTLRPELMRRKAVPVGNWPTVADIRPGTLVLDSDGTIWKKEADVSFSVISMTMAETVFVDETGNIFITENMNIFVED